MEKSSEICERPGGRGGKDRMEKSSEICERPGGRGGENRMEKSSENYLGASWRKGR
jgi:hypothetical protein